uniref:Acyl carrier protein n=1 Tax=Thalassionema nitzschioides TaxID=33649 RepID=A0A6T5Y4V4_9STRA|mmetsp:Transcript_28058/g.41442  ORF Transcript_28058/g.41442 Transcript_28058/m.41442 type:complete len:110 (-) Transcript_28058:124-453(-)|eukprot:CAMPEP_0194211152 /NCGR_PEP_ID=MMETSP0156-20130528/9639_1 /TAXON_ID=33649 /ORGANISM="Thalassionema nitzschioides, Strain L26-B" /LENGTH=109 /DNA_ID=CAMNT_0038938613 /DNA_START=28 /DNA_END=357 /DNA_ORIENTATION=+
MKVIAFLAAIASVSAFAPSPAFSRTRTSLALSDAEYETLQNIIAEQLEADVSKVKKEASFTEDLDADSLDVVEMVMAIEEEFEIEIEDESASAIKTVGDVCDYLDANRS